MTLSTTSSRIDYAGDGSTTVFAVPFKFFANSDISAALRTDATGAEVLWVEGTDYTLTGAKLPAGGTLTATTAPATGTTLVIKRIGPEVQETDLPAGGALPSDAIENQLDYLTMLAQQLQEQINRVAALAQTSPTTGLTFPEPSADDVIGWNTAGDNLENKTPSAGGGGSVTSVFGRTGDVVAATGDYKADQIDETAGLIFFTPTEAGKLGGIEAGAQVNYLGKRSIKVDASAYQLVGDADTPADFSYYGVLGGVRGWYKLPITGDGIWDFDSATVAAFPGQGEFRLNAGAWATVTEIYIAGESGAALDYADLFEDASAGQIFRITQANDQDRAAIFILSAVPVKAGTAPNHWYTLQVTLSDEGAQFLQNGQRCAFHFLGVGGGPAVVSEVKRLSQFGSKAQGDLALNAAFASLDSDGGGRLEIDGIFDVPAAPNVMPDVPLDIRGDGGDWSQLVKGDPGVEFRLLAKDTTTRVAHFKLRDLRLVGDWAGAQSGGGDGTRLIRVVAMDRALFHGVELYYSRQMSLTCGVSNEVDIRHCRVVCSARDAINVTNSENVSIHACVVMHCGDDMIAVHDSRAVAANVRKTIKITDNIGIDTIGIKSLGAQEALIEGNVLNFIKNKGIDLGRDGAEGQLGNRNIFVLGNTITNITPGALSGLGTVHKAIRMSAPGDPITNLVLEGNVGGNILANGSYTGFRVVTDTSVNPSLEMFTQTGFINPTVDWTGMQAYEIRASNAAAQTRIGDGTLPGVESNHFAGMSAGTITDI